MRKKLHHIHKIRHIPNRTMRWYGESILLLLLGFLSRALLLNFTRHQLCSMLLKGSSCHSHKADVMLGLSWTHSAKIHWDIQTKALNFLQRIHSTAGTSEWHLLISVQTGKATKEDYVKEEISAEEKNDMSIFLLKTAELLKWLQWEICVLWHSEELSFRS